MTEIVRRLEAESGRPKISLSITAPRWGSAGEMRDARRSIDDYPQFREPRGALNRRVDIVFADLGLCTSERLIQMLVNR
jgi:hypothetical protein